MGWRILVLYTKLYAFHALFRLFIYDRTNTVVYYDWKDGNSYLHMWAMSNTIYAGKLEQFYFVILSPGLNMRRKFANESSLSK